MLFEQKDVAVVDLTHAGVPLALSIVPFASSVTGIDIYGTVNRMERTLLEKSGIAVSGSIQDNTDLVVAPIHLDPGLLPEGMNCAVISHHRAVGELLVHAGIRAQIIEITGTGAKTSTAALLADTASREMSVISHTSRGVEQWHNGWPHMIHHGLSIAPGSILEALKHTHGINPDLYIFEISLGGTGAADLGIITSFDNAYTIAGGCRLSTDAKKQIIDYAKQGSTLLIPLNAGEIEVPDGIQPVTFSETSNDADYFLDSSGRHWTIYNGSRMFRFTPHAGYDPGAYTTAFVCATAAASLIGVHPDTIESALAGFQGVKGRMQVVKHAGRIMLDNSSSGMNPLSLERALEYSASIPDGNSHRVCIVGEEAQQVCEGLDPDAVNTFIRYHGRELDAIILVGERMHALSGDNIYHACSLEDGLEMAESLTAENDLIISCVKCFR